MPLFNLNFLVGWWPLTDKRWYCMWCSCLISAVCFMPSSFSVSAVCTVITNFSSNYQLLYSHVISESVVRDKWPLDRLSVQLSLRKFASPEDQTSDPLGYKSIDLPIELIRQASYLLNLPSIQIISTEWWCFFFFKLMHFNNLNIYFFQLPTNTGGPDFSDTDPIVIYDEDIAANLPNQNWQWF